MAQSVIDKLEVRDARWVPGALVVVLLSLLGAWLAVQTMESLHQMQRAEERARTCRIPDDCIDPKRYPLFMARAVLQELIESLQSTRGVKSC